MVDIFDVAQSHTSGSAGIPNFELPVAKATVGTLLTYRWNTWEDIYTTCGDWLLRKRMRMLQTVVVFKIT